MLPIAMHVALLVAGLGVLRVAGVLQPFTATRALAAGGLAYLIGVAVVMQLSVLLLVLNVPVGLPTVAALCGALACPLLWGAQDALRSARLALPRRWPPRQRLGAEWRVALVASVTFALLAVIGLMAVSNTPIGKLDYDVWNIWARKAGLLFFSPDLPLAIFQSPSSGFLHPDYPIVLPLLEAVHLRALGRYELSSVHTVVWILGVAFVWAGAFIASRVARPSLWALLFPGVFVLTLPQLLTAYADVPVALYLGLGVLCLGLWLESHRRQDLILGALLLAGAAGLKNEGLLGAAAAFAVLLMIVGMQRRRHRVIEVASAIAGVLALGVLPWRIWLVAHGLKGDLPLHKGLEPSFLADRFSRVWPAVQGLYGQLINVQTVSVLVPIAMAMVIVRLSRRGRVIAGYYLAVGAVYFVALVWAYWISPLDIAFHVGTSAHRIFVGISFIALAAVVQLADPADSQEDDSARVS